eukprot:1994366-Amphidinium_carterae.1
MLRHCRCQGSDAGGKSSGWLGRLYTGVSAFTRFTSVDQPWVVIVLRVTERPIESHRDMHPVRTPSLLCDSL